MSSYRIGAVALGSNLGDREKTLASAVRGLERAEGVTVLRRSTWHETAPVGGPEGQPDFLNGAVSIETKLDPEELLQLLQELERKAGRDRSAEVRNGPRTLDLDLLFLGEEVRDGQGLQLPHPRMGGRLFVLEPLCEVLPDAVLPGGAGTPRQLLERLHGESSE